MKMDTDNPTADPLTGPFRFPQPGAKRPRSQAQINASRRNGAKSRGPQTQQGRVRSRQNALKHGLISRIIAPPGDPRAHDELYRKIRGDLIDEFAPDTCTEVVEVDTLAHLIVQQIRAIRLIEALQAPQFDPEDLQQSARLAQGRRDLALIEQAVRHLAGEGPKLKAGDARRVGELVVEAVTRMEAELSDEETSLAAARARKARRDEAMKQAPLDAEVGLAAVELEDLESRRWGEESFGAVRMDARGGGFGYDDPTMVPNSPDPEDELLDRIDGDQEYERAWSAFRAQIAALRACGAFFHDANAIARAVRGAAIGDHPKRLLLEVLRERQQGMLDWLASVDGSPDVTRIPQVISRHELALALEPGPLMMLQRYLIGIRCEIRRSIQRLRKR